MPDRAKAAVASHAAGSMGLDALAEARRAMEARSLSPRVAAQAARAAASGPAFQRLWREWQHAHFQLRDVAASEGLAVEQAARLAEAERVVRAAREAGADVPGRVDGQLGDLAERTAHAFQFLVRLREKQPAATPR